MWDANVFLRRFDPSGVFSGPPFGLTHCQSNSIVVTWFVSSLSFIRVRRIFKKELNWLRSTSTHSSGRDIWLKWEYTINCHQGDGKHISMRFRCPLISKRREDLINEIKQSELPSVNVRLLFPIEFSNSGPVWFDESGYHRNRSSKRFDRFLDEQQLLPQTETAYLVRSCSWVRVVPHWLRLHETNLSLHIHIIETLHQSISVMFLFILSLEVICFGHKQRRPVNSDVLPLRYSSDDNQGAMISQQLSENRFVSHLLTYCAGVRKRLSCPRTATKQYQIQADGGKKTAEVLYIQHILSD